MKQRNDELLQLLKQGNLRTIGKVDTVVQMVDNEPKYFDDLFSMIENTDSGVRMRASDAVENVTDKNSKLLTNTHKIALLKRLAHIDQQEVQWHIAQIIPRLPLQKDDMPAVKLIFNKYLLKTKSNIVRVNTLQALTELALMDLLSKEETFRAIELCTEVIGTPSIKARSRKLLKILSKKN